MADKELYIEKMNRWDEIMAVLNEIPEFREYLALRDELDELENKVKEADKSGDKPDYTVNPTGITDPTEVFKTSSLFEKGNRYD